MKPLTRRAARLATAMVVAAWMGAVGVAVQGQGPAQAPTLTEPQLQEARQAYDAIFQAFADNVRSTEALVVDGDQVAQVMTIEGTNLGGLMGLPPSGKHFRMPAVFLYDFRGDKIVRERRIYDFTGMLVQIGLLKARPA